MDTDNYENILVHALVNLGDVLLTTSAIAVLRKKYPKARITMMVKPYAEGLVKNNRLIDEVIVVVGVINVELSPKEFLELIHRDDDA